LSSLEGTKYQDAYKGLTAVSNLSLKPEIDVAAMRLQELLSRRNDENVYTVDLDLVKQLRNLSRHVTNGEQLKANRVVNAITEWAEQTHQREMLWRTINNQTESVRVLVGQESKRQLEREETISKRDMLELNRKFAMLVLTAVREGTKKFWGALDRTLTQLPEEAGTAVRGLVEERFRLNTGEEDGLTFMLRKEMGTAYEEFSKNSSVQQPILLTI